MDKIWNKQWMSALLIPICIELAVFAYWLGSCTALLMACYSMRLVYLTFISSVMSIDISTYLLRYWLAMTILYDQYKTRLVKYYRGMVVAMPLYSLIFMVLILSNASIPLGCGFVGEFLSLLASLWVYSVFSALLASLGIVLSAGYWCMDIEREFKGGSPLKEKNYGHEKW